MPVVLITPEALVNVRGPWVSMLEEAGLTVAYPEDPTFTRGLYSAAETVRVLRPASAVIAGGEYFTPEILAGLPQLRVIARAGVGYDRVDVPAATSRKIAVTITPTANHEGVAEQAFALIFAIAKGVVVNDAADPCGAMVAGGDRAAARQDAGPVRTGTHWPQHGDSRAGDGNDRHRQRDVSRSGIRQAARRRAGRLRCTPGPQRLPEPALSAQCPDRPHVQSRRFRQNEARQRADQHVARPARGRGRPARGSPAGSTGGAGLDVFENEPATADNPLFALKNVVVSPHLGGADKLSQDNMAIEAADCIAKLYRGEWPTGAVVNDELRPDGSGSL